MLKSLNNITSDTQKLLSGAGFQIWLTVTICHQSLIPILSYHSEWRTDRNTDIMFVRKQNYSNFGRDVKWQNFEEKKLVGETWRTSGILKVLNFRWPFEVGRNAKVSFSEWKRCPHKDRSYSKQRTYTHTNRRTHSAVHKDGEDLLQTTSHKTQTAEFIISCLMRHHYC